MKVTVDQVLFAEAEDSSLKALRGESTGQYDFRYGKKPDFLPFFSSIEQTSATPKGGWDKHIPIAPFDGPDPVAARTMTLHYMGPGAARKDDLYFRAQQPGSGYPLWNPPRAFAQSTARSELMNDVALIIRDTHCAFHARWIRAADRTSLPPALNAAITSQKKGVWMPSVAPLAHLSPLAQRVLDALREHTNVLLYGPPATGKTQLISDVRAAFDSGGVTLDTADERTPISSGGGSNARSTWVTFHQSYAYEDFVVGLRPEPGAAGVGFSLVAHPGVLLEIAEWARQSDDNESLLVIDEINRGNVSRIFGEFITLMEPDKRDGAASTVPLRLPYASADSPITVTLPDSRTVTVPHPFTMPQKVYTLATMNSVDKSVAPLDAALRRRFHVIPIFPDFSSLVSPGAPEALKAGVGALTLINRRVAGFLGPDFAFGHWFLKPVVEAEDEAQGRSALVSIWVNQVFPQLEEHFVGRPEQLLSVLGSAGATDPYEEVRPEDEALAQGASSFVRHKPDATDTHIVALWNRLASPAS